MQTRNDIFESVQFINESLGLALLSIPLVIVSTAAVGNKILSTLDKRAIKKALEELGQSKGVYDFNKKAHKCIFMSANELINKIRINEKDAEILKHNNVICSAIVDKHGNIMAYCIYSNVEYGKNKYGYYICDKTIPKSHELDIFVKSTFELQLGIVADGIEKLMDDKKLHKIYPAPNAKANDNWSKADMSDEERKKFIESFNKLKDILFKYLKQKFPKYDIKVVERDSGLVYITILDPELPDIDDDYKEYDKYISSTKFKNAINNCRGAVIDFAKKYNFEIESDEPYGYGLEARKSKEFPFINIEWSAPDDEDSLSVITIHTNNRFKF